VATSSNYLKSISTPSGYQSIIEGVKTKYDSAASCHPDVRVQDVPDVRFDWVSMELGNLKILVSNGKERTILSIYI
jgi:hypothetical protein